MQSVSELRKKKCNWTGHCLWCQWGVTALWATQHDCERKTVITKTGIIHSLNMLISKAKRHSISLNHNIIFLLAFIHSFMHAFTSCFLTPPSAHMSYQLEDSSTKESTAELQCSTWFFYLLWKLLLKHSAKCLSEVKINHPLNLCYSHCVGKLWEATVPARPALKEHRTVPSAHRLPKHS